MKYIQKIIPVLTFTFFSLAACNNGTKAVQTNAENIKEQQLYLRGLLK